MNTRSFPSLPRRLISILLVLLLMMPFAGCRANGVRETPKRKEKKTMDAIEIIPGRSIGEVRVGEQAGKLPKRAVFQGMSGELDGVHFSISSGKVDDVWIEDLRTLKLEVNLAGRLIPRNAPLKEIKKILGACEKVQGIKGGVFFVCKSGLTLGCDFNEQGDFVQLRIKPVAGE